ncbi:protein phosphatase 2C domain-containing protein [Saccharothrix coeruleofusca]|uniref:protein phosphatase 2C domain-containing protein n=1 Tax=Saccharothrix coeruleofusca TaxID=33919 RepID=UPI0016713605|nr:protein phosphatase 2C domain-containing protein [Saccharothrix coeruleofusca]MBP2335915.1 hypothetical protein [Saccharothrix coeruleofusca]
MVEIRVAEQAGVGVTGRERPTEDHVVVLDNAVAVLDGATNLTPGLPSGGWYAGVLAHRLGELLRAAPEADLADLLAEAIRAVVEAEGLVPGRSPSSTVAVARWTPDRVDALVLADSPIAAFGPRGYQVLVDEHLSRLPRSPHTFRERLRTGGGYDQAHLEALREGMTRTATYRNTPDGFWVAEADPEAARHASRASWPREEVGALLLATDGVSCGVTDYGLLTWPEALDLARSRGPRAVLDVVREAEATDPGGVRWPRAKRHDDQALVLVDGL